MLGLATVILLLMLALFCIVTSLACVRSYEHRGDFHARTKRAAIIGQQWPNSTIPYIIDVDFDAHLELRFITIPNSVLDGMQAIMEVSCVKFVQFNPTKHTHAVTVRFSDTDKLCQMDKYLCASYVGYRSDIEQDICFGTGCFGCLHNGIVIHELLHTVGLFHEHIRPDRDKYVDINWAALHADSMDSFQILSHKTFGYTPYDLQSIMHYEDRGYFSKPTSKSVLTPLQGTIPLRHSCHKFMTSSDIFRLNRWSKCPASGLRCEDYAPKSECGRRYSCQNPSVARTCRKTCGLCQTQVGKEVTCLDRLESKEQCVYWSKLGECHRYSSFMRLYCRKSCGLC